MSDLIPTGVLYGNLATGGGTTNYNDLDNRPKINGVTLQGNKTASALNLLSPGDIPVTSVNGDTGAVVLDGNDIDYVPGTSVNTKIYQVEQSIPIIPVTSVNGETGAVVLDGNDIKYDTNTTINAKINAVESEIPTIPVTSVNGETGAVVLDGSDISYDTTYTVNGRIDYVESLIDGGAVVSVNGETGVVVLDGSDIEYSSGISVNSKIDMVNSGVTSINTYMTNMIITDDYSESATINAGSSTDVDFNISKTGYTVLGCVGFNCYYSDLVASRVLIRNSTTMRMNIRNIGSSNRTATVTVTMLYLKNP